MADSKKDAQLARHPDDIADEIRKMLRENGYFLLDLKFCGKRGGAHDYSSNAARAYG